MIHTAALAGNDERFRDVAQLYLPRGYRVLDMTYGTGVFWRLIDDGYYDLVTNDLSHEVECDIHYNFTCLPERWELSFDAAVLDPPYKLTGTPRSKDRYGNLPNQYADVLGLYGSGILEAHRILKSEGILITKSQDQVVSGKRVPISIHIHDIACRAGFRYVDTLIKVNGKARPQPHLRQIHARSNHSQFTVFRLRA